jgi:hypothetical protein
MTFVLWKNEGPPVDRDDGPSLHGNDLHLDNTLRCEAAYFGTTVAPM